jgi:tRNA pseudouridine(55) synthase
VQLLVHCIKILKKIILLNKKEGETPLEALGVFRKKNLEYKNEKMTYAGRLDPMASGLLLVLAGKEVKNKEKYLKLDKEYEFKILFGFSTDTYDILGKVLKVKKFKVDKNKLEVLIKQDLKYFTGKFMQKYPLYSSKTVDGKPLYSYARANNKVKIPSREVSIKEIKLLKIETMSSKKLLENIEKRVAKVKGDFRQEEILKVWKKSVYPSVFFLAEFKIKCGSGTYVRGIANSLGEKIRIPALAFYIKRTKIGKYK